MKKWIVIAVVMLAGAAQAQSQYQTAFEVGVGYTRPGAGQFDMVTLLMQGDDYLVETGIGLKVDGETQFSWLIRGALRPAMAGNTILHIGAEYSLHSNSVFKDVAPGVQELNSLSTVGVLFGASHPLTDHLNFEVHVFPLVFEFGGNDTVTRFLTAQLGAHILF